jgi:DNA-binding CsgD family transcriptional regulator
MACLSAREQGVLKLLAEDQSTKDIALNLGITVGTLSKHLAKIYRLLKVKNRTEAVATIASSNASGRSIIRNLGPREQKVLRLLADDRSTRDIAADLGVAMSTLRNHLTNIYHVLRVGGRQEAVALFRSSSSFPDGILPSSTLPPADPARLSSREREALTLLAEDQSREDIALNLGITEGTLRGLLRDVYRKLGVRNRQDAVATIRQSNAQPPTLLTGLSPRERAVLKLLADAQSTKDIGLRLNVTTGTVFVYISNICRILGVRSRAEAIEQFRSKSASVASTPTGADG